MLALIVEMDVCLELVLSSPNGPFQQLVVPPEGLHGIPSDQVDLVVSMGIRIIVLFFVFLGGLCFVLLQNLPLVDSTPLVSNFDPIETTNAVFCQSRSKEVHVLVLILLKVGTYFFG